MCGFDIPINLCVDTTHFFIGLFLFKKINSCYNVMLHTLERSYMNNDIVKLLNLEQFNLKIEKLDTSKTDNILYCYISLKNQKDICPSCSSLPITHGYKIKKIKHSISNNNPCFIIYNARRFYCKICKHTYYEKILLPLKIINCLIIQFMLF